VSDQRHVLVVEDNEAVTAAMRVLLESIDLRVTTAESIADALGVIGPGDAPHLALLDLTLPDGDGLSLVEPLRAAGTRVLVALTGHDNAETRKRCLDAGCTEVLVKPVPARDLIARVAAWVSG
jgi:two-component system, OmpR family, KDP operon response regulator KdpE